MKKLLLLLLVVIAFSCSDDDNNTPATQDVVITSHDELMAFAAKNITHLQGSLTLKGNMGSEDAAELASLQKIDGALVINTSSFIKLTGLKNLTEAGSININNNFSLASLDGLTGLKKVTGEFHLNDNNLIQDLTGLNNLVSVGQLFIEGQQIRSIEALHNLTEAESITIHTTVSTKGLEGITSVKTLILSGVTSLEGLENFTSAETITLSSTFLHDLSNLEAITELKSLQIENDYTLTSLAGLENLQKVNLFILTNTTVKSLTALQGLTAIGADLDNSGIYMWNNDFDSLDGLEHITAFKGSVVLEENVTSFCPLQTILSTGQLGSVILKRHGKPVPTVQDIIAGNCTVD